MSTTSPVVSNARVVVAPSWLKVKTQIRAGDKALDFGGPMEIPSASQTGTLRELTARIRR